MKANRRVPALFKDNSSLRAPALYRQGRNSLPRVPKSETMALTHPEIRGMSDKAASEERAMRIDRCVQGLLVAGILAFAPSGPTAASAAIEQTLILMEGRRR
jgi:hypothetical protein